MMSEQIKQQETHTFLSHKEEGSFLIKTGYSADLF